LFRANGGVATAHQLRGLGFTEARLRRLIRQGKLVAVRRGVYAASVHIAWAKLDPARWQAFLLAAVLVGTGAECAGSHWTAARIHGLDLLDPPDEGIVAVTQAPGGVGSRSSRPGIRIHEAELPVGDLMRRFAIPVTTVARTVIDIARSETFRNGVVVADSALHSEKTTRGELQAVLAACPQWPGIARARAAVDFSDTRSESVLESLARVIMSERQLPPPELQVWITDAQGSRFARTDFYWAQYRTIGEADGALKYKDPSAARDQLERDRKLRNAGYEIVHFGWRGIVYETDEVVAEFTRAFARGESRVR
jgi:putative AbiEi antitoxin of type IV toxin-antitoxin system